MNESILDILIRRDQMTESEALGLIQEAHETFDDYLADCDMEGAENICTEYFGLEPDFLDEFL